MRIRFYIFLSVFTAVLLPLASSCVPSEPGREEKTYTIGFSQCTTDDMWRKIMMIQMEAEATKYPNVRLIIKDAGNNSETQVGQVRAFLDEGVDLLIISPKESAPVTPIAVEAYKSGIPTIIWDRKIESEEYSCLISADNYEIGRDVGQYVKSILPSGSKILEIRGLKGSSPAKDRHDGFVDVIGTDYTLSSIAGDWQGSVARARVEDLAVYDDIDLVFGHNDDMAIAAYDVINAADSASARRIRFLGIDAIVGVDAVLDGRLDASFLYPPGGEFVIRTAVSILHGEKVEKSYTLKSARVDITNAATLKNQSEQILTYQNHINTQRQELDNMAVSYNLLRKSTFTVVLFAVFVFILALVAAFASRTLRRQNRRLQARNAEIEKHTDELARKNAEIENLSNQKLQFFTNLSHEIRTPLTLILNPLDKMAKNEKDPSIQNDIWTLKRNANRLLKIVNQILDFRKIENNKMILSVREVDIVSMTEEIVKYFEAYAQSEKIVYKFRTEVASCRLWLDTDKIEQVLTNLISNAFKNARKYGVITVSVTEIEEDVVIEVHDTGKGMDLNTQQHIFDRFYSVGPGQSHGIGIGLHLSKEYVEMHRGKLTVESEPGHHTSFFVTLHKGREHLPNDTFFVSGADTDAEKCIADEGNLAAMLSKHYDSTVLVAEDEADIRDYLASELAANFNVITAVDGYDATRKVLENKVDIVLSDVLMPHINGFQLCRDIKTNLATSHIPVVLLTALSDDSQQIYGIAEGADEYIRKPFNIEYVKIKLIRILEDRRQIAETFTRKLNASNMLDVKITDIPCAEDIFRDRLSDYLEKNYDKEELGVEDMGETLGMSRVQLYRKTMALLGMPPVNLIRSFRLNKGAGFLKSGKNVAEAAYMTGFTSPAYFTRCFKEQFGMTPTEYIAKNNE